MAWVRRDIKDHQAPSLCHGLVAPLSTSGCPGPYPAWSWTPPWLTGLLSIRFPLSLGFLSNYMNSGQSPTQLSVPRKELLHWYFQSLLPCLKNNNNNNKISPPPQKKKEAFRVYWTFTSHIKKEIEKFLLLCYYSSIQFYPSILWRHAQHRKVLKNIYKMLNRIKQMDMCSVCTLLITNMISVYI